MEFSFIKTPVDTPKKNVFGYIPQIKEKSILAKKINAVYRSGLINTLEKLEGKSYVDYTESTAGDLRIFEFSVVRNNKKIHFFHVYDGLFPWKMSSSDKEKVIRRINETANRRKYFDDSFFDSTEKSIKKNFKHASVIPTEKGYKVIFAKGTISSKTQIFVVNFQ